MEAGSGALKHSDKVVRACEEGGVWTQALKLLSTTFHNRIEMATITCAVTVNACVKSGESTQARSS